MFKKVKQFYKEHKKEILVGSVTFVFGVISTALIGKYKENHTVWNEIIGSVTEFPTLDSAVEGFEELANTSNHPILVGHSTTNRNEMRFGVYDETELINAGLRKHYL